jgi:hypothetical protein
MIRSRVLFRRVCKKLSEYAGCTISKQPNNNHALQYKMKSQADLRPVIDSPNLPHGTRVTHTSTKMKSEAGTRP